MGNSQKELFYIGSISDIAKGATRRVPGAYSEIYYSLGIDTKGNFYILFLLRSKNQDKNYFREEYTRRQKPQITQPIAFGHGQDARYLSLRGDFYRRPENRRLYISVETIPCDSTDKDVQTVFEEEILREEVRFNRLRTIRASQEPVILPSQSLS